MKRPAIPVLITPDSADGDSGKALESIPDEAATGGATLDGISVDDTFAGIVNANSSANSSATSSASAESAVEAEQGVFAEVKSPEKGFLHVLGIALSAALLLLVAGLAALVIVVPFVTGGQALTVLTQSMEPGYPPGTLIVIKPTPVSDIRIGDVMTYQITSGEAAVVSHRVVTKSIGSDGLTTFTTKGDNNDLADPNPVQEVQIKGTLWYAIPYLGYVNNAVNGESRQLIVPIAAGGLFLYAAFMVVGSVRDRRRKEKAAALVS